MSQQYFDIKTAEPSIDESHRSHLIEIIRTRWGDTPKGSCTIQQLEAWAEYGDPRAFYEQQYSYDPIFHESNGRTEVPLPLNDTHAKKSDLKVMRDLPTSGYTRKVLQSSYAEDIRNCEKLIRKFITTLVAHYPLLKDIYTTDIMARLAENIYKMKYETIGHIVSRLTYRLSHHRGIYMDLDDIIERLGLERTGSASIYETLTELDIPEPDVYMVNENMVTRMRAMITNLVQLDRLSPHDAGLLNDKLDRLDRTSLCNTKKYRAEINLMLLIEDILHQDTHHLTQLYFPKDKLTVRNLRYARHHHTFSFPTSHSSVTHHSIYKTMVHEFGLDIPFSIFTTFTSRIMDLQSSEELAAVLIYKTLNQSSGVRSIIEMLADKPLDLFSEYKTFMQANADHEVFTDLLTAMHQDMEVEPMTFDQIKQAVAQPVYPLEDRIIIPGNLLSQLGIDLTQTSRIIVLQEGHVDTGYSHTFIEIALSLIRQGAWYTDGEKFLSSLAHTPELYAMVHDTISTTHEGKCDDWGVNFLPTAKYSGKQLLALHEEVHTIDEYAVPGTVIIEDHQFVAYDALFPDYHRLSLLTIHGTSLWMDFRYAKGRIMPTPCSATTTQNIFLMGFRGEIRRGLVAKTIGPVLWLESEDAFREEIRRVFWKNHTATLDTDKLIRDHELVFLDSPFTSLQQLHDFLMLNPPFTMPIILPDIRPLLKRHSELLDREFDMNRYEAECLSSLYQSIGERRNAANEAIDQTERLYTTKLDNQELTPIMYTQLMDAYRTEKLRLFSIWETASKQAFTAHMAGLRKDRQRAITKDLLDKYHATYDHDAALLHAIMMLNQISIGCSIAKNTKLRQESPPFTSRHPLDQQLLRLDGMRFIHTGFPITSGMLLHDGDTQERIVLS